MNKKDLGRKKKRKDGPSKGAGNAVGVNSGKKGSRKNDGPTAGNISKKSGSNDVTSRKTSGKAMNVKEAGRTKEQNGGYSKGAGRNETLTEGQDEIEPMRKKKKRRKKRAKNDTEKRRVEKLHEKSTK